MKAAACTLAVCCAFAQTGVWERRAPYPDTVTEVSGAAIDGKLYMLCGLAATDRPAALNIYDPAADSWSRGANMPIAGGADHCNVAAAGGRLYLLGAIRVGTNFTEGGVYEYDPAADRWERVAGMLTPRGASGVAVVGRRIYVAGGLSGNGTVFDNFDVFDTETRRWTALPAMANRRDHLTAQAVGARVYVISGRVGGVMIAATEEYDTETGAWRNRAPIPVARGGIGSGVIGGRIVVFGGEGNSGTPEQTFEETHEYDPATDSWRRLANMLTPRHGFYGVTVNQRIYAPGGGPRIGATYSNAHEVFFFPQAATPRIHDGGVRNAASLGASIAPGAIVSLFGERLSSATTSAGTRELPLVLNATEVRAGARRLPLFFVSPGQLNLQLPFDFAPGPFTLVVTNSGASSPPFEGEATAGFAPGIFSFTQDGRGQGAILIAGTATVASPARPARRGEAIEIYCTGLGTVTVVPGAGQPTASAPLSRTVAAPVVTIGGVPAEVLYSGLAPGLVSVYQVNALVPTGAADGAAVPLRLRIGEPPAESNMVTIAISP